MTQEKLLIVGYCPLLYGSENKSPFINPNDLNIQVIYNPQAQELSHIEAIVWSENEAMLFMKKAKEIKEHMLWYSQENIPDWFQVRMRKCEDRYNLIIEPNYQKMLNRTKINYLTIYEKFIDDNQITIIYLPLSYISQNMGQYPTMITKLKSHLNVNLIEKEEGEKLFSNWTPGKEIDVPHELIIPLGNLPLKKE